METKTSGKHNHGWQLFSETHRNIFVSDELMKALNKKRGTKDKITVQKYLPIKYFLDSMNDKFFYLASPSKWVDPFEMKYLHTLEQPNFREKNIDILDQLREMHIFCCCMTYNDTENEEASWRSYGNRENIIRVTYDFDKLCKILSEVTEGRLYIGKIMYTSRKNIITNKQIKRFPEKNSCDDAEVLYVNNFCFKQSAYKHEQELRFCMIKRGMEFLGNEDCKILNIDLTSAITKITLPPILEKESSKRGNKRKAIKLKEVCPNVTIHQSNLYNMNEVDMTTEIIL